MAEPKESKTTCPQCGSEDTEIRDHDRSDHHAVLRCPWCGLDGWVIYHPSMCLGCGGYDRHEEWCDELKNPESYPDVE